MATAKIYQPAKTAMQSGKTAAQGWVLEYQPEGPKRKDPLMGWVSSSDMQAQIHLRFDTLEEAVAYAQREGIDFEMISSSPVRFHKKTYSANFS